MDWIDTSSGIPIVKTTSTEFRKWALPYLGIEYIQVEGKPIWLNDRYAAKLYTSPEYLTNVIEAHSVLDDERYSSRLITSYRNDDIGEYGVVEEYIKGVNLSTVDPKQAEEMINDFYLLMQKRFNAADWDLNPENYVVEEGSGLLVMVDLGDVFFE